MTEPSAPRVDSPVDSDVDPHVERDIELRVDPAVVSPSREDSVVRRLSAIVGGPAGSRIAATRGFWSAATVLVLLATAMLGFGFVQKQHCRSEGWSTPDMFWHACYSDIPVLYGSAHLAGSGPLESVRNPDLGQPPVVSLAMWAVSAVVGTDEGARAPRAFFDLSTVALAVALAVAVIALVLAVGKRRSWDAAHLALSPVLVTAGLLSYALLGVALAALALLAWSRSRSLAAGLLLGAAVLASPAAGVLAVAVLAVGLRAGRAREALTVVAATAGVWFGVRLLAFPGADGGIPDLWEGWRDATPGYGSLWLVPQLVEQGKPGRVTTWLPVHALSGSAATTGVLLGMTVVVIATLTLALAPRRRPRLAHVALFAVAGTLLVSKALPVQASLLLLPVVALAGLRWRDHLLWAATELTYFVAVWLYIAAASKPDRGLPAGFYLVFLLLRLAGIAWLAVQAVRLARDPERDPVRTPLDGAPGEDDPLGGPVEDADDRLVVELT